MWEFLNGIHQLQKKGYEGRNVGIEKKTFNYTVLFKENFSLLLLPVQTMIKIPIINVARHLL